MHNFAMDRTVCLVQSSFMQNSNTLQIAEAGADIGTRSAYSALVPGVALCLAVTAAGFVLEKIEIALFGKAWLESLVLAILLGSAVRSCWRPSSRFTGG